MWGGKTYDPPSKTPRVNYIRKVGLAAKDSPRPHEVTMAILLPILSSSSSTPQAWLIWTCAGALGRDAELLRRISRVRKTTTKQEQVCGVTLLGLLAMIQRLILVNLYLNQLHALQLPGPRALGNRGYIPPTLSSSTTCIRPPHDTSHAVSFSLLSSLSSLPCTSIDAMQQ